MLVLVLLLCLLLGIGMGAVRASVGGGQLLSPSAFLSTLVSADEPSRRRPADTAPDEFKFKFKFASTSALALPPSDALAAPTAPNATQPQQLHFDRSRFIQLPRLFTHRRLLRTRLTNFTNRA